MDATHGPDDVVIEVHGAADAPMLLDVVSDLYRDVFAPPPFNATAETVLDQRGYFPKVAARPGFRLVLARFADRFVGFGYGYLLPADSRWWHGVVEALDDAFTQEDGSRTFAVIDYGVPPGARGLGIGRAVHDSLLGDSGAQRATLAVRPTATETQAIYRRWGWRKVGHEIMKPPSPSPVFDILVLETMPSMPTQMSAPLADGPAV